MSYYKTRFMFCKLNVRGILYLMVQLPILFDICFECLRHLCLCLICLNNLTFKFMLMVSRSKLIWFCCMNWPVFNQASYISVFTLSQTNPIWQTQYSLYGNWFSFIQLFIIRNLNNQMAHFLNVIISYMVESTISEAKDFFIMKNKISLLLLKNFQT